MKKKGHCSELMGLELLQSQQGNRRESSVRPEHVGVSGKCGNGERRNFCTLREITGLKRQRRKEKKQQEGKDQMDKDIS